VILTLKRNVVYLALALLVWLGYSDLNEVKEAAAAATKNPLRPIEAADVEGREPDPDWVLARDPYELVKPVAHVERKSSGPSPRAAAEANSTTHVSRSATVHMAGGVLLPGPPVPGLHSLLHVTGVDLSHWQEIADALAARDTQTCDAPPVEPPPPPPPLPAVQFTLHLQSTLALAAGNQARISGQTVVVGDTLKNLDPYAPPVLRSVDGSVAVVTDRGIDYVLDLDHNATIEVIAGGPAMADASAAAAAPRPSGQAMGHGGTNPRTSNRAPTGGATPPKAAAAKPAAAPAPGAPKKGNYKARSYPGKPKS
jgi:hypothetical protein